MISRPEWDEAIFIFIAGPGDKSPGYFQSPLWGSAEEQDNQVGM